MADSEISTTLPVVSRRRMISTTFAASTAPFLPDGGAAKAMPSEPLDPAILAWRQWQVAHRKSLALCRKQQLLETRLHRAVGMPDTLIVPQGGNKPIRVLSSRQLDDLVDTQSVSASQRLEILSKLKAHQERWKEADGSLGYSAALQHEAQAAKIEQQLAEVLWSTPSTSLAGIKAKIEALIATGQWREECEELPWPQIRSVLADLRRLQQASDGA
jgi:hypothetical protein